MLEAKGVKEVEGRDLLGRDSGLEEDLFDDAEATLRELPQFAENFAAAENLEQKEHGTN